MGDTIEIKGKTALVTGGARRIGAAIAEALALAGANVIIHYHQSQAEAQVLMFGFRARGAGAWAIQGDLSEPAVAEKFFDEAVAQAGPIDFLVNNASIFPATALRDMTAADVHQNIDANALSPFVLARRFAGQGREGAIVNLLDSRVVDYDAQHAPYHLAKRMLYALTNMMAIEFAPGVRVNAVAPGLILPPPGEDESYLERMASTNPLQRHGSAEGIAEAVLFLLRGGFITGQTIFVDGGRHLKGRMYG